MTVRRQAVGELDGVMEQAALRLAGDDGDAHRVDSDRERRGAGARGAEALTRSIVQSGRVGSCQRVRAADARGT